MEYRLTCHITKKLGFRQQKNETPRWQYTYVVYIDALIRRSNHMLLTNTRSDTRPPLCYNRLSEFMWYTTRKTIWKTFGVIHQLRRARGGNSRVVRFQ